LTFDHDVDDVVKIVEGAGVAILVLGSLAVLVHSAILWLFSRRDTSAYWYFRRHLGRVILLGLELLIVADIIRTVIVDPTPSSVAVLATIVAIRIVLSWSLEVEIDGAWPWRRARATQRWSGEVGEGPDTSRERTPRRPGPG
jgi:uncharacterized membrane protein